MKKSVTLEELKKFREARKNCARLKNQIAALSGKCLGAALDNTAEQRLNSFQLKLLKEGLINNSLKLEEKRRRLKSETLNIKRRLPEISAFLKTLADEEIKETIELYYIDGLNYMEVAECMGAFGDGTTQMKKVRRYFERQGAGGTADK